MDKEWPLWGSLELLRIKGNFSILRLISPPEGNLMYNSSALHMETAA
jgi:hypothetical protein